MAKNIFNKLVRDNIPDIIKSKEKCKIKICVLDDEEYLQALNIKLQEELKEYLLSGEVEELADLEEVLRAVLKVKNVPYDQFEKIRLDKANKRGSFDKKIFLESVENED